MDTPSVLSRRLLSLSESATLAMASKARELQEKGRKVIKLNLGEPDFETPEFIQKAAIDAINSGKYFSYPPVPGYKDLREAIAKKLKRDNNLDYSFEQVVVSTGAKQSIANILLSILNPDDEVIIFTPYWVTYIEQVRLAEGTPILIKGELSNDFKVTANQLAKAITPKTKAVLFSSPCNPTGAVFSKEELKEIANILKDKDIIIISDEIYEYINYNKKHESIAQFDEVKGQTVIVNGFSKGFAMTGWRLGYIAAPIWLAKACTKLQGQVTSATCGISQRAGNAAVNGSLKDTNIMLEAYKRRKRLVIDLLTKIPGVKCNNPEGAFYIFPDVSFYFGKKNNHTVIKSSSDLAMYLLNDAHVAVVDGGAFGEENCIRISFAASDEDLVEGLSKIRSSLEKLR